MVKASQVTDGLMAFAEAELLPAFSQGAQWVAHFVFDFARSHTAKSTGKPKGGATAMFGVADKDGMVDIDGVINALKETARKHGPLQVAITDFLPEQSLPALITNMKMFADFQTVEFRLNESSFEALRGFIESAGVPKTEG